MNGAMADGPLHVRQAEATISGAALRSLRSLLEQLGYGTIYRLISNGLFRRDFRRRLNDEIAFLTEEVRLAVELCYLGRKVARRNCEDAFGAALIAKLVKMDVVVEREDESMSSSLRLELDGDNYLLTEGVLTDPLGVYYDVDSRFLSHMIEGRRGDCCLDLCAGTGVQGLRLAGQATRVDSVDLNARAVHLSRINYAMNDLAGRANLYHGDLWGALPDGVKYDHIVSNPPLAPVVEGVPYPMCGDGGPDGLSVTNRILTGLQDRLTDEGRCTMIGACTKSGEVVGIVDSIAKHLATGFHCGLFILSETAMDEWVRQAADTTGWLYPGFSANRAMLEARLKYAESLDTDSVVCFLLKIRRADEPRLLDVVDFSPNRRASSWMLDPWPADRSRS
jgi:methylase of polypeptide subunit release factors